MSVDFTQIRRELPASKMPSAGTFIRRIRAHRTGRRTGRTFTRSVMAVVKRCADGQYRVELPPWLVSASWWRYGRRVWISIRRAELYITAQPRGRRGVKRCSVRISRVALAVVRRSPNSDMLCGQKLSDLHARRCNGTPKQRELALPLEVAR